MTQHRYTTPSRQTQLEESQIPSARDPHPILIVQIQFSLLFSGHVLSFLLDIRRNDLQSVPESIVEEGPTFESIISILHSLVLTNNSLSVRIDAEHDENDESYSDHDCVL